jgi:hypothetical protein
MVLVLLRTYTAVAQKAVSAGSTILALSKYATIKT